MKGRKWICALLALVLLGSILPLGARAIDHIDLSRTGTLTITSKYNEQTPLKEAEFQLYRVAVPDIQCNLTATDRFLPLTAGWNLNKLDQEEWQALADHLMTQVRENRLTPDRAEKTNEAGRVTFEQLELGLYLILSAPHRQDLITFEPKPVLVMVPNRNMTGDDIDSWHYSVELTDKPVEAKDALKVIKFWDDNNNEAHKRPDRLTIYLLKDGADFASVTLPQNGKWEYIWENLEYGPKWSVREDTSKLEKIPYHCGEPIRDDKGTDYIVWTITNTYTPPGPEELPQTGQLWWPVPVLLTAGLFFVLLGLLRRRGENHEG